MARKKPYILPGLFLIIAVIGTIAIYRYRKNREPLGRIAAKKLRPPKVRIVYSKKWKPKDRPKVSSSEDAVQIFRELWGSGIEAYEEFIVLLLDRSNRVLGFHHLSKGGTAGTVADIKLIYSVALEALASSIILSHNHPSGNLKPSDADLRLTKKTVETGKIMDVPVLDHIILTKEGYYSFADEGAL